MLTALILLQLTIVLTLIFIGARVGGFGLGILVGGRGIELKSTEQNRHTAQREFSVDNIGKLSRVGIVYGYADCSSVPMQAFTDTGFNSIVWGGVGDGNFYKDVFDVALKARAKDINIACSSGIPMETTCLSGKIDDAQYHFVAALTLNLKKVRVLLILALAKTRVWQRIQEFFNKY